MIAGAEEFATSKVPNGEGKFTSEVFRTFFAVFFIEVKDDFAVAVGGEVMPFSFEHFADFLVAVEFSIDGGDKCSVFIYEGLANFVSAGEREKVMTNGDVVLGREPSALTIGAPVSLCVELVRKFCWVDGARVSNFDEDAAHFLVEGEEGF